MENNDNDAVYYEAPEINLQPTEEVTKDFIVAELINGLAQEVHEANQKWWVDLHTGEPVQRNVGELLALVHSELSEAVEDHPEYNIVIMEVAKALSRALEGVRKDKMDDKLPHRKAFEVELADAVIRIFDIAAGFNLDLGNAYVEKLKFNSAREDHRIEARLKVDGKKF